MPLFTTGRARLLDNERLVAQFAGLVRTTSPSGRDKVDHGKTGMDDVCNAAAGAMILATSASKKISWSAVAGNTSFDTSTGKRHVRPPSLDDVQSTFGSVVYDGGPNREWQPMIKRLPTNAGYLTDGGCSKPPTQGE